MLLQDRMLPQDEVQSQNFLVAVSEHNKKASSANFIWFMVKPIRWAEFHASLHICWQIQKTTIAKIEKCISIDSASKWSLDLDLCLKSLADVAEMSTIDHF